MRTVIKKYNIYKFDELDKKTKNLILENYVNDMITLIDKNTLPKNSNLYKAIKKAKDMKTSWFLGNYILEYCENDILEDVRKCEYFENGDVYDEEY